LINLYFVIFNFYSITVGLLHFVIASDLSRQVEAEAKQSMIDCHGLVPSQRQADRHSSTCSG